MRKPSLLIIIIVSCLAYANTLFNGFVYDDTAQVLENLWIVDLANIPKIFSASAWSFMGEGESFHYYRPMMHTIYALEYRVFTLDPRFYHLVNILLHALNAVLVFLLASALFASEKEGDEPKDADYSVKGFSLFPFIAAIFFAVHPIMSESVAWVAAVPELSYTAFFLLSFYLYILSSKESRNEQSGFYFLKSPAYIFSFISFFVALFCKEPAMMLPLVLISFDLVRRRSLFSFVGFVRYLPFVVLAAVYIAIRAHALGGLGAKFTEHYYLTGFQNFLNIGPLLFKYLMTLLVPMKFSPFYVFYPALSILEASALFSWAVILVLLAAYVYLFVKRSSIFVAATLLIAPLLPVLYVPVFSTSVFALRYLYLPVVGFTIIMAFVVRKIFLNYRPAPAVMPIKPVAVGVILITLFALSSYKTISRNSVWRDDLTLWTKTLEFYPKNYHAYMNIGKTYVATGDQELAKGAYRNAVKYNLEFSHPKSYPLAESWFNLGLTQFETGDIEGSIASYREALSIKVKATLTRDVLNNLGNAYASGGRLDDAIKSYERALVIDPADAYARHNLKTVRGWMKK